MRFRIVLTWLIVAALSAGVFGRAVGQDSPSPDRTDGKAAVNDHLLLFVSAFAKEDEGAIWSFRLNLESGELQRLQRTTDIDQPFFLALSPKSSEGPRRLYATHAPDGFGGKGEEQVIAYELTGDEGGLRELNRQSTRGAASCYLDVDPSGRSLVVANYTSGDVAMLPITKTGALEPAASYHRHVGSSVNPKRQQEPHAHCFVVSPDGRFALAADLGIDRVLKYRLDAAKGKLEPAAIQPFMKTAPGAGPRHLTFHPDGRRVYVINEIGNTVAVYDYQPQSGALQQKQTISTLPQGYEERTHTADVKLTPNGKFLYGTNRGHDSIACYRVAEDGALTLSAIEPSLGKGPQNLAVTADGRWLLCANMPGNNLAVFRIDGATGKLQSVGQPVELPMPSCIMLVE